MKSNDPNDPETRPLSARVVQMALGVLGGLCLVVYFSIQSLSDLIPAFLVSNAIGLFILANFFFVAIIAISLFHWKGNPRPPLGTCPDEGTGLYRVLYRLALPVDSILDRLQKLVDRYGFSNVDVRGAFVGIIMLGSYTLFLIFIAPYVNTQKYHSVSSTQEKIYKQLVREQENDWMSAFPEGMIDTETNYNPGIMEKARLWQEVSKIAPIADDVRRIENQIRGLKRRINTRQNMMVAFPQDNTPENKKELEELKKELIELEKRHKARQLELYQLKSQVMNK